MEHYKECSEYRSEVGEYKAGAFLTYFDKVTRVMIEKGLDVALPILAKLRSSLTPIEPTHY